MIAQLSYKQICSSKTSKLRQQRRRDQIQQKMTNYRFNQQVKTFINQQSQYVDSQSIINLTQQHYKQLLTQQKLDDLYIIIIHANFDVIKIIQLYPQQLLSLLFQNIHLPKGILSLTNIIKKSQLIIMVLYELNKFNMILTCLKKKMNNSNQQQIYLRCIQSLLKLYNKNIDKIDERTLISIIQTIFNDQLSNKIQHITTINIIKLILQNCTAQYINIDFLRLVINYFWIFQNDINISNIYLIAITIIQRQLYGESLTIILDVIQIIIKGKPRIISALSNKIQPIINIMTKLFINYNQNYESISLKGQLQIDGNVKMITIHDFFIIFQSQIFQSSKIDKQYCTFLQQFLLKYDGDGLFNILNNNGMLEFIISQMCQSQEICQLALKTIFFMIFNNKDMQFRQTIITLMKYSNIQKSLQICLLKFHNNSALQQIVQSLLGLLIIKNK